MRSYGTWIYYGVGLICLALAVWLVVFPPGNRGEGGPSGPSGDANPDEVGQSSAVTGPSEDPNVGSAEGTDISEFILPAPQAPPAELEGRERETWIIEYCEQLAEYSYLKDMKSLERLLAELASAELKIAESAYHHLMARHDRRAIPYLEVRIAAATSAFEKKHLQELVDFLRTKGINESDLIRNPDNR